MLRLFLIVVAIAVQGVIATTQNAPAESDLRQRIPARRAFEHSARIVTDNDQATGNIKVWILPGEDDMRLHTPKGGQTERDFQVSYILPGGASLPSFVSMLFETRAETKPGPPPQGLAIVAAAWSFTRLRQECLLPIS